MPTTVAERLQAVFAWMARVLGVAMVLMSTMCLTGTAAEPRKPHGESVYKGHRLTTFLNEATRQATIQLNDREIVVKADVTRIGKITTVDLANSFLYYLNLKTAAGCGSYVIVRVALLAEAGKSEVLSDFGACNDQITVAVQRRQGWASWYVIAFRDDRATARVAFSKDEKLATRDVKAQPCLFVAAVQPDCHQAIMAEAFGSGTLGMLTGAGAFADQKIATFVNHKTGKATMQLNGRVFRTFENARDFYLANVNGDGQFGLFVFFLKQASGCTTRPLVFFAGAASQPEVITDFAPCTDQMARQTRKKENTIQWSGIAYRAGERLGYIVSVTDNKLSTRDIMLPACMTEGDKARVNGCVLGALAAPPTAEPPQQRVIPMPPPPSRMSPKAPSTLGI